MVKPPDNSSILIYHLMVGTTSAKFDTFKDYAFVFMSLKLKKFTHKSYE